MMVQWLFQPALFAALVTGSAMAHGACGEGPEGVARAAANFVSSQTKQEAASIDVAIEDRTLKAAIEAALAERGFHVSQRNTGTQGPASHLTLFRFEGQIVRVFAMLILDGGKTISAILCEPSDPPKREKSPTRCPGDDDSILISTKRGAQS